jgi:integrin beta 3
VTSGRDEAKKRRGRGKAEEGPSDDELGWLAELRHSREDRAGFGGPPPGEPAAPGGREPAPDLPRRPLGRESPIDLAARRAAAGEVLDPTAVPHRAAGGGALDQPTVPRRARPETLADAPPLAAPAARPPRPSPTPVPRTADRPTERTSMLRPVDRRPDHTSVLRPVERATEAQHRLEPPSRPQGRYEPPSPRGAAPYLETGPRHASPRNAGPMPPMQPRVLPPPGRTAARVGGMQGIDLDQTTVLPLGSALMRQLQLRQVSRLRTATFVLLLLAVVGAPAAFFVIREFTRDPVFVELDNLDVPQWAAGKHTDGAIGSRWCIRECRSRSRTWESARGPEETNRAYVAALKRAGWVPWNIPDCQAAGVDGIETCWQRDEYVLDLWVRAAVCDVKGIRPTVSPSGAARPSAAPSAPATPTDICPAAVASIKVYNRISYQPGG